MGDLAILALCILATHRVARSQGVPIFAGEIVKLAKDYQPQGVAIAAISSNSVKTHPQDGPDQMAADAKQLGMALTLSNSSCTRCR